jgi:2-polyprenyl-6-methoxyphenol hydroxylase-like FAD-dependent oxidoreductase
MGSAEFDVVVVGAGPVGLTLAIDLGQRGARTLLIEKDPATKQWPKMDLSNARTMEFFGMNTGVGDAIDLSWKLAGTIHGWGGPGLLDSYEPERRRVGARNAGRARPGLHAYRPDRQPGCRAAACRVPAAWGAEQPGGFQPGGGIGGVVRTGPRAID